MSDPNCPFCQIVNGEIKSKKVYSDDNVMAVLDINPARRGHVVIFPKKHHTIMPQIPPDEFKHLSKKAFCLSKSLKSSIVATSNKIFIANGGAAGQQTSHFLMHIIPAGSLFNLSEMEETDAKIYSDLKKNINIMMSNHYKRENKIMTNNTETEHLFETPNYSVKIPNNIVIKGHLRIKSNLNKWKKEDVEDIFYASSYAATACFEYLGAEGTNIIMNDNSGEFFIDILPRFSNDGIDLHWDPMKIDEKEMESIKDSISLGTIGMEDYLIKEKKKEFKINNNFSYRKFKKIKPSGDNFISNKFK